MARMHEASVPWNSEEKTDSSSDTKAGLGPHKRLRTKLGQTYAVMFDADWYQRNYLANSDLAPANAVRFLDECIQDNAATLRNPSAFFDLIWYGYHYHADRPELSGIELLNDFFDHVGVSERRPSPLFAPDWYYGRYEDAQQRIASGVTSSVLEDYLRFGGPGGLRPNGWFDEMWYRKEHPEIMDDLAAKKIISGYHHFLTIGQFQGFDPEPRFSSRRYLSAHPDVAAAVASRHMPSAFYHFIYYGEHEGRPRGNDVVNGVSLNVAL